MRAALNVVALATLLGLAACGGAEPEAKPETEATAKTVAEPSAAVSDEVKKVAELAKAIKAEPEKAAELFQAAGMDEATFRQQLFDIAADAKKSANYRKLMQ